MDITSVEIRPIGVVRNDRTRPRSAEWDRVESRIDLDTDIFDGSALLGIEQFSHLEVISLLHLIEPTDVETGARGARGDARYPITGVFARRSPRHPNRLALGRCRLVSRADASLTVRGLDAIDGTPVIDIKPWMSPYAPRGAVREPGWVTELLHDFF